MLSLWAATPFSVSVQVDVPKYTDCSEWHLKYVLYTQVSVAFGSWPVSGRTLPSAAICPWHSHVQGLQICPPICGNCNKASSSQRAEELQVEHSLASLSLHTYVHHNCTSTQKKLTIHYSQVAHLLDVLEPQDVLWDWDYSNGCMYVCMYVCM